MDAPDPRHSGTKVAWTGLIHSVQPRIRLTRSFDQREHEYLGYVLRLDGFIDGEQRDFGVAISQLDQEKHRFCADQLVEGEGWPVANPNMEVAELYRVSKLRIVEQAAEEVCAGPPWRGEPPPLRTYRERGHRRLSSVTYDTACVRCMWGCRMPVEIIVDHWKPSVRKHRFETFCYGPLSCRIHMPGPTRKVPGRRGMSWEEADWVDQEAVAHRGPDD